MPRPHPPTATELQQKVNELQTKLLRANAALRVKVVYAERLELVVCERNKRVDTLYGQLQLAWQRNQKLEQECEHLASLVANSGPPLLADAANA